MSRSTSRAPSNSVREAFEMRLPFRLDSFQRRSLDAIDAGHSVLVAAPTSAGKTVVAEYAVAHAVAQGRKAFYTTPIKALSNQKFGDLARQHGTGQVGLLTGDNTINSRAPIVVMTTEVLRNMLYEGSPTLDGLGAVILDEVHYLQDPFRGAVWEEVIIHLPPDVLLTCLSATVSNAEEVGDWLRTVRGGTDVVIEERRPVDLEHLYLVSLRDRRELLLLPTFVEEHGRRVANRKASRFDPTLGPGRRRARDTARGPRPGTPRRTDVIEVLGEQDMLPVIWFVFSRAGCDAAVDRCLTHRVVLTSPDERQAIRGVVERHCGGLGAGDLTALGYERWSEGLEAGIAAHHAGMIPPMKEAVEELFSAGLLKVVFATETLALGVNMPARSVIIERLTKFTGEQHENLTPGEYTQLTGRAGRRGIDERGFAVVLWNRFTTFEQVAGLASRRTYELTSSFRPTYNMAANLVRRHDREEARRILKLSFAQYRIDSAVVSRERELDEVRTRLSELRRLAECDRGDVEEYEAARRELASFRSRSSGKKVREAALGELRPGDVVDVGPRYGRVVVLARARTGGAPSVTAVDGAGKTVRLSVASFREPPVPVGRVRLPEPFAPKSPKFRKEASRRLRRATSRSSQPLRPRRADETGADDALRDLRGRVERHPVSTCPAVSDHLTALEEMRRLERRAERLGKRPRGDHDDLAAILDRVVSVLEECGYINDWKLTSKGQILRRVHGERDLLVVEAVHAGCFDGLEIAETAALASLFTYEERRPGGEGLARLWPSVATRERAEQVITVWEDLQAAEVRAGLRGTKEPDPGFVEAVHAWADGAPLDEVLDTQELTGGDFVRNVKQVIDLLRQLADAVGPNERGHRFRETAEAVFRGVVELSARVDV